jgi:hypothetical protein
MIIQFKDRKKELGEIREFLDSDSQSRLLIIYGRRRVGKTELALKAVEGRKALYYLATEENNLKRFYTECIKYDADASKLKMDWEILFGFLKDRADAVIIDEFQNMISEDKSIISMFQLIVDVVLRGSKLKIIILGSSVSVITSKVLAYKSPLYGRRAGSIKLKPVQFFSMNEFFPNASIEQLAEIFGFGDGIPFYLVKIEKKFWQWLKKEVDQEKSFLRDEIDFLLMYEFTNVSTYKMVLEAIANGKTELNEIKNFIGLQRTDITPYIRNMIEVGFIQRKVPITENLRSRHGRYFILDNFIKFWFRYIYPALSSIEAGIFDVETIKSDYNSYLGFVFEDICRQFIIKTMPFSFTKIGPWWHGSNEIDIVALNEKTGDAFFIECKWKNNVDAEGVLDGLKRKASCVYWNKKMKEHYCIMAKSFSGSRPDDCMLFDIKDIEKAFHA